jgi:hypothetical protein
MSRGYAIALIICALLAGGIIGWWCCSIKAERDMRQVALVQQIAVAGLCTNTLGLLDEGETATADRILFDRLESSIHFAQQMAEGDIKLEKTLPNIRDSLKRSAGYLEARDSRYAQMAANLVEKLQ